VFTFEKYNRGQHKAQVSHHSIELSWMNAENKPRNGPPERWTRFSVEQMDPKTHTYSTVYMSVFSVKYPLKCQFTQHSKPLSCNFSPRTVDVDVYDKMGFSPLMVAAQKGFTSLVDILVKHGADINKKDSTGKESLMQACFAGHLDTVKYLRNCGSTCESQDTDGCTPLHWAVDGVHLPVITYMIQDGSISGNAAVASILLQAGADVNVRDKAGKTPLMVAVLNNHVELVKLLLYGGADHHMKNEYGAGAADMAKAFVRQVT
uniref:Fibronectin type 3 and ankyrin repeat domains protein 1-like n=1 Tax=Sinocyclocheilus anshuiensis TaxID=1608454 RepID=A0A671R536_9TELE